jgi:hypothetical protein
VLESAKKDFGDVVLQAQREIGMFTGEEHARTSSTDGQGTSATRGLPTDQTEAEADADSPSTPEGAESSLSSSDITETNGPTSPSSTQLFFARLQSALPPTITSIPDSLKHASDNIDLAQLRTHAGEYVHKSEIMLREAVKEAGEVLKDVVKIVPPEEAEEGGMGGSAVGWDGSDMWLLLSAVGDPNGQEKGKGKGKARQSSLSTAERAVSTRAEALLKRLRRDPEIIKHDPQADGEVRAHFEEWVLAEVDSKEAGFGGEVWREKVLESLGEPDGEALKATHDALGMFEFSVNTPGRIEY